MSVLVAVPSYERPQLLRYCLLTAAELHRSEHSDIVVFDDASPNLDLAMAIGELPVTVKRSEKNLGPSGTICRIWRDFLESSHKFLLMLDSDMIANRNALEIGIEHYSRIDGMLSLYNSIMHPGDRADSDLLRKQRLGNAGTFWTRDLVTLCLSELDGQEFIDDRYSELFNARGVPMYTVAQSRLQHLGIRGRHNGLFGYLEHGQNFIADSETQMLAILETYDALMSDQHAFRRPSLKRRVATAIGSLTKKKAVQA